MFKTQCSVTLRELRSCLLERRARRMRGLRQDMHIFGVRFPVSGNGLTRRKSAKGVGN